MPVAHSECLWRSDPQAEMDTDNSGNISRKELEAAMKKMYGRPLDAPILDKMLKEADVDGDGEISFPEFRMMMRATERAKEASAKLEKTMGLWFKVRDHHASRTSALLRCPL